MPPIRESSIQGNRCCFHLNQQDPLRQEKQMQQAVAASLLPQGSFQSTAQDSGRVWSTQKTEGTELTMQNQTWRFIPLSA